MTKRDEYIGKMKTQLDALNSDIDQLEVQAKEAKGDAKDKYKEEMGKLQHQKQLAIAKFDELMTAGEDTWENLVAEMERIRDAFKHSFHYFKSQLKA